MNSIRIARQGDVQAVIDQDFGVMWPRHIDDLAREFKELARGHLLLANLDEAATDAGRLMDCPDL